MIVHTGAFYLALTDFLCNASLKTPCACDHLPWQAVKQIVKSSNTVQQIVKWFLCNWNVSIEKDNHQGCFSECRYMNGVLRFEMEYCRYSSSGIFCLDCVITAFCNCNIPATLMSSFMVHSLVSCSCLNRRNNDLIELGWVNISLEYQLCPYNGDTWKQISK